MLKIPLFICFTVYIFRVYCNILKMHYLVLSFLISFQVILLRARYGGGYRLVDLAFIVNIYLCFMPIFVPVLQLVETAVLNTFCVFLIIIFMLSFSGKHQFSLTGCYPTADETAFFNFQSSSDLYLIAFSLIYLFFWQD